MDEELATIQNAIGIMQEIAINYGFQFVAALVILIIGWQISKFAASLVLRLCERLKLDITLSRFFAGLARTIILTFVVIVALGKFGITIAPFVAALGAVVFGSTLALQGPMSNYGAGLTIVLTRPFVVGDTIRINDVIGIVEEIKLAYTLLSNEDGERIMIPNNRIIGEIIFNSFENLIVEQGIVIDHESDAAFAVELIKNRLAEYREIVDEPKAQVGINDFPDGGVEIGLRYWIPTRQYFELKYQINQSLFRVLKENNIVLAYPKRIITLDKTVATEMNRRESI